MATTASDSPETATSSHSASLARAQELEAECSGQSDQPRAAILAHEAGALYEHLVCDRINAIRCYRTSFKLDPNFTPPLLALQRIYSDAFDYARLAQVLEARHLAAQGPALRAALMTEHALVVSDLIGDSARAEALLESALDTDPNCQSAALMLELQALSRGELNDATLALEYQTNQVSDVALRSALLRELAQRHFSEGSSAEARALLASAARLSHGRYSALCALHDHGLANAPDNGSSHSQTSRDIDYALAWKLDSCLRFANGEDRAVEDDNAPFGRFLTPVQAATHAVTLAWETSARQWHVYRDADAAHSAFAQAVHLLPATLCTRSQLAVLEQYVTSCWRSRRFDALGHTLESQLSLAESDIDRLRFEYHCAENMLAQGQHHEGTLRLRSALHLSPNNPAIIALLERALLQSADFSGLCAERLRRADAGGPDAAQLYLHAAFVAACALGDGSRATELCNRIEPTDGHWALESQRLLFVEALIQDWSSVALSAASRLGRQSPDISERGFFVRYAHGLQREATSANKTRPTAIEPELQHNPDATTWAPHVARVQAAQANNAPRLVDAHQLLASLPGTSQQRSAHLIAGARALLSTATQPGSTSAGVDHKRAIDLLESALTNEPDNAYAMALLQRLLRRQGDGLRAMTLLQKDAQLHSDQKQAAKRLVTSGIVALTSGHPEFATARFREALTSDSTRCDAWFGLWTAALACNLSTELAHATAGLGHLNLLDDTGLELAELTLETRNPTASAEYAEQAIDDSTSGFSAALMALAHHTNTPAHEVATRFLEQQCPEHCWAPRARPPVLETRQDTASPLSLVYQATASVSTRVKFRERAEAWHTLAQNCPPHGAPEAHAELTLQSIHCHLLSGQPQARAQAITMASALQELLPENPTTLFAQMAAIGPAEPSGLRAPLLQKKVRIHGKESQSVRCQWIQTQLECDQPQSALHSAQSLAKQYPSSPACLELWRYAAVRCGAQSDIVAANDALAGHCAPEQAVELLLESARILRDTQKDPEGAEQKLRAALAISPRSTHAFNQLHDLLIDMGDPEPLLECISSFLDHPHPPALEVGLHYEAAQISATLENRSSALISLRALLQINPRHASALSLLAQTYVELEEYRNAVIALNRLAETDIPSRQRRVARLGSTDFLLGPLNDPAGARSQLEALRESQLAEAADLARLAELYAKDNQIGFAVQAYEDAAQRESDGRACQWLKAVAQLYDKRPGFEDCVISAYRRALEAMPTDRAAHRALHRRLRAPAERTQEVSRFINSIQARLPSHPTQPELLRALRMAGSHGAMPHTEFAALDALRELGEANHAEQTAHQLLRQQLQLSGTSTFTDDELRILRTEDFDDDYAPFAKLCTELIAKTVPSALQELNLKRRQRIEIRPHSAELLPTLNRFGLTLRNLYQSANLGRHCTLLQAGSPDEVDCIISNTWDECEDAQLQFELGSLALAQRLEFLPLLRLGPAARRAALTGAVPSAPEAASDEAVQKAVRRFRPHLSRKMRADIARAAPAPEHASSLAALFVHELDSMLIRGGLVACGALKPALRRTNAGAPAGSVSKQSIDLYRFWLSPQARALRGENPNVGGRTGGTP